MSAEDAVRDAVGILVPVVESCGAAIIAAGALWTFVRMLYVAVHTRQTAAFVPLRLSLGRYLTLGLEFQLAGDVLRTAIAPSFREIGQLAAIAAIRTALNYFLSRELAEERRQVAGQDPAARPDKSTAGTPPTG